MTGWDLLMLIGVVLLCVVLEEWEKWREMRKHTRGFRR